MSYQQQGAALKPQDMEAPKKGLPLITAIPASSTAIVDLVLNSKEAAKATTKAAGPEKEKWQSSGTKHAAQVAYLASAMEIDGSGEEKKRKKPTECLGAKMAWQDAPSDAGFSPTLPPPAPKAELQHEDFNALDFEDSEGADEWYDECTKEQWKAGMAIMASLGQVLTEPDWRTVNLFDE